MEIDATFDECFEVGRGRMQAEHIFKTLNLAGCRHSDKSVYRWLDERFAKDDRVRKVRPKGRRVWVGIRPRLHIEKCECCGALSKLSHATPGPPHSAFAALKQCARVPPP